MPNHSPGRHKYCPEVIQAKQVANEAVKLRIAGKTFREIAEILHYNSQQAAFDAVKRTLIATAREPADELRSLELERLDELWQVAFGKAKEGDLSAQQSCIRILERRARLVGLDAPQKTTYTDPNGNGPLEVIVRLEAKDVTSIQPKDK